MKMQTWFIKKDYKSEYDGRLSENGNMGVIAEQMCNEGKGVSFLNVNPKSTILLSNLLMPYKNNKDYFEVSIIVDSNDELTELLEKLGGEVITISPSSGIYIDPFEIDNKILENTKIEGLENVLRYQRSKPIKLRASIQTMEDIKRSIFDIALMETGLDKDKFVGVESSSYGNIQYWKEKLYSDIKDLRALGKYISEYKHRKELFEDNSWDEKAINDYIFDLDIDRDEDLTIQIAAELGTELELNRDLTMLQIMINVDKENGNWNIKFHAD